MRVLKLWGMILLIVAAASCGGNTTTAGVTITFPLTNPIAVPENGNQQFGANVSGVGTTSVNWQVCLASAVSSIQPTTCTPVQGVTIKGQTALSGYGTITPNGLYTAPNTIPQPNLFVVMASSTIDPTAFAVFSVSISAGIQIQITPTTASIQQGEHYQFTATVTGATNSSVTWSANQTPGGSSTIGYICPNPAAPQPCTAGEFFALDTTPTAVVITATSVQDPTVTASVTLAVLPATVPILKSVNPVDPSTIAEGSAQQDVYVAGTGFFSTTSLQINGIVLPSTDVTFLSSTLMRVTIPGTFFEQPGLSQVYVVSQNGILSPISASLNVVPVRPALVAVTPDTVSQVQSSTTFSLTGGFYVPTATVAQFDGSSSLLTMSYVDSRHLNVTIPSGSLAAAGLHQLVLHNTDAASENPPVASLTAKNVAVTPNPGSISTSPGAPIAVGANPTAVAIDYATGTALVANTGAGTVSVVNLASNTVTANIAVGNSPTGVAVDDLISPPLALVVNSADQTVSTINLATMSVVGPPLSISLTTLNPPLPFAVGINPLTHRAMVSYSNSQVATILDISTGAAVLVQQVGGTSTLFGSGQSPFIAIDPRLNWAITSPGGSGIGQIDIVDLGRNAVPGVDSGRIPQLLAVAALSATNTTLGIGLNTETHQILFTNPRAGYLTAFSLLDQTVDNITFSNAGVTINEADLVAAATNPFADIGIAVNTNGTAVVVDLDSGVALQNVSGLGSMPAAVAIDPASNEAVVANQGDGTVSIVSLGTIRTPQILESSPATTLTSLSPVTLTLTGAGFTSGSVVRLDQVALATSTVPASCTGAPAVCRQITATVPASMLGFARRYMVDVLNADLSVSNVTDFTVIQAVTVGTTPVGVAVDTDRDLAVVTNSADGTVSLVALSPQTPIFGGGTAGVVGTIGSPIPVDGNPQGVAELPRVGLALVANNGSNSVSVVDVTGATAPSTDQLCIGCQPVGVAVNGDTGFAAVTNNQVNNSVNVGGVTVVELLSGGLVGTNIQKVDQFPTGVAMDPALDFAGVAASQSNGFNVLNVATGELAAPLLSNFNLPAGVNFDPLNQVFMVANSAEDTVVLVNPTSFQINSFRVGIDPTTVDYDFQTSTMLTVNSLTNTISVLDYDCPPSNVPNGCANPQVRAAVTGGSPQVYSSVIVGPNSLAIDPLLDLMVTVDPDNNRVLLIPIPH